MSELRGKVYLPSNKGRDHWSIERRGRSGQAGGAGADFVPGNRKISSRHQEEVIKTHRQGFIRDSMENIPSGGLELMSVSFSTSGSPQPALLLFSSDMSSTLTS